MVRMPTFAGYKIHSVLCVTSLCHEGKSDLLFCKVFLSFYSGVYWRQKANERLGDSPRANKEPLMVKDTVETPQLSFG